MSQTTYLNPKGEGNWDVLDLEKMRTRVHRFEESSGDLKSTFPSINTMALWSGQRRSYGKRRPNLEDYEGTQYR